LSEFTDQASHGIYDYLENALRGNESAAFNVVEGLLSNGSTVADIYLNLLAPAQRELGLRWSTGTLSIANEHIATEITSHLMDRIRDGARRKTVHGKRAVVSAAPGERHALAARMVSDFLHLDGWEVDYLGADMPGAELADFAGRSRPDLVAISAILALDLSTLRDAIQRVRSLAPQAKILLGGTAITSEQQANDLGAHGFAGDAAEAIVVARRMVGLEAGETIEGLLNQIGENIQLMRRSKNWNQQQLASAAGIDRTYLSGVENGKQNLSVTALHKLASALDIRISDLLN
jgi:methanogenic corrinoid protein MtbC1/DNA-binding XRE family transcriptional regulator